MIEKILERLKALYDMNEKTKNTAYEEQDWEKFDLFMHRNEGVYFAIKIVQEVAKEYGNGWIPVETALPTDCDNRFYECIVENHEEDLPMFCQYEEGYGFGFWHNYYDGYSLGFVDSEFETNEELGYEKVIAWKPITPYQKGE